MLKMLSGTRTRPARACGKLSSIVIQLLICTYFAQLVLLTQAFVVYQGWSRALVQIHGPMLPSSIRTFRWVWLERNARKAGLKEKLIKTSTSSMVALSPSFSRMQIVYRAQARSAVYAYSLVSVEEKRCLPCKSRVCSNSSGRSTDVERTFRLSAFHRLSKDVLY